MKNKKLKKCFCAVFSVFLSILLLFSGCSLNEWIENETQYAVNDDIIFTYELPSNQPSILVNQLGYNTNSEKIVFFIGENVPDTFSIIDANTKETVFTGNIENKGFQNGEYISSGSFTELTKLGEYYILCDIIGQSYHFEISDVIYDTLITSLLLEINGARWNNYHTTAESNSDEIEVSGGWYTARTDEEKVRDVKKGCKTLIHLLLSTELYLEEQKDNVGIDESGNDIPDILDECAYEVFWLLKMQDIKTGAVYSGVVEKNDDLNLEEQNYVACQHFIIAMAKFSYVMKNYDNVFATECLRAADTAWKYIETERNSLKEDIAGNDIREDLRFFGAAELYRASGGYRYHSVVTEYISTMNEESQWSEEEYLGVYTYLGTRLTVRKNLCEELMKQVMSLGEKIAYESKENKLLSIEVPYGKDCQNLLEKMLIMTSVDYIIGNHEYDTILENNIHYLLGRNINSYSYVKGFGNDEKINSIDLGICRDFEQTSALIFMLSEILSNQ